MLDFLFSTIFYTLLTALLSALPEGVGLAIAELLAFFALLP